MPGGLAPGWGWHVRAPSGSGIRGLSLPGSQAQATGMLSPRPCAGSPEGVPLVRTLWVASNRDSA